MTLLLSVGCSGNIGQPNAEVPRAEPVPEVPMPQPMAPAAAAPVAPLEDPFTLSRTSIQLLPFSVRLAKVAAIVGLPTSHPLLAPLREARVALGDHDYAHGIPADRSWSAAKLTAWVGAVRPICGSSEFKARYPALDPSGPAIGGEGALNALIEAAYGRAAEEDDRAQIAAALAELPNQTPEAQSEAVCLAILSSLEMVAQ